jgi:hypothetical protein
MEEAAFRQQLLLRNKQNVSGQLNYNNKTMMMTSPKNLPAINASKNSRNNVGRRYASVGRRHPSPTESEMARYLEVVESIEQQRS